MSTEGKSETHESFGLLELHRTQGGKRILFGSSILHHNTVRLTISRAERNRDLNRNWYHGRQELIEIEMSPTQFAEAITTLNVGPGVPCTIRHVNMKHMEEPPYSDTRLQFQDEFEADMVKISTKTYETINKIKSMLGGKSGKTELKELLNMVEMLKQDLESNIPFVRRQFQTQVEQSVTEAKGEIDAAITHAVMTTGIESIKANAPKLIEGKP